MGMGKIDIDFQELMDQNTLDESRKLSNLSVEGMRTWVCVRKRILFEKESKDGQVDCVSCQNPNIRVMEPKYKIDGITKFIENQDFIFDNSYGDNCTTENIYESNVQPTLDQIFNDGISTVFAYGQTGSGKTFTMEGIQDLAIADIFKLAATTYKLSLIHI